ncbi:MAG: methionyl-tRNA formyltransferase [Dehalococcoidia bacterium]|jgi:methionyl-tRNA formyltransferase|nr:methionyl-tRNA formyltransferase [Dehalococcoidia bacterium]
MRIVLFGQAAFGKDVFDALLEAGENVIGVSTPKPGERGDPLHDAATEAGVPSIVTRDLRKEEAFEQYRALDPELLVFAFVTDIVRKNVLDVPKHGTIQYHPSLLPLHRGISSMAWPVISGEPKTGISIFWVDEGIDTGPILLQREAEILFTDTVGSLYFDRLYPMGVEMLVEAVGMVREGTAPRIDQDHSLATYEPPIRDEHGIVDFSRPGPNVYNHVRGCDPQPGASVSLNGERLRLFSPSYAVGNPDEAPGTVTATVDGAIEIAVIGGTLTIGRVQADGARKVAAADLVNVGDVLERA